jgi:gamma-glutamyltranspeptidase/glutathione hydrolase
MLTASPESAAVYAPEGRLLGEGERVRFDDLAESLEQLGREGTGAMRDGSLARVIVDHLSERGGLVTRDDLAAYQVIDRAPLRVGYRGVTLLTNPPPSSGGALIAIALRAMEEQAPAGADAVARYRALARAGVAANAVRDERFHADLGEEDCVERLWARRPTGTTHTSAVDADGGMASLSSSNGSGSGVMAAGTGILLNNMLGEEDLNPGGFGQLEPGERMTSMMAPSLLLRDGEPVMALGSAGSNRLRSAILQTVVNLVDAGMDVPAAVRFPRIHPEGDGIDVEGGVGDDAAEALLADGHRIRRWGETNLFFGGVSAAGFGRDGFEAAGDPRRGGAAAAVTAAGEVIDL